MTIASRGDRTGRRRPWAVAGALALALGALAAPAHAAAKTPTRAAAKAKDELATLQAQAAGLFAAQKDTEALDLLEAGIKAHPGLELCNYYRAEIRKRAFEERAITFLKALALEPGASREAQFNLAFAYIDKIPRVGPMGAGFLSKRSIASFKKVLDEEPDNWIANYGIGMNYLHWPEYFKKGESALSYLEKCLELQAKQKRQPYFLLAYLRLGDAHARNNDVDKAVAVWQEALKLYPQHGDLVARLDIPKDKLAQAVNDYYNPNQSMAAIDTDVSVLWASVPPKSAVPIKRPATRMGAGGQLASGGGDLKASDIGLFSWFVRNLPFLSDRRNHSSVDMSILGVDPKSGESQLASRVAHGMILGFLAVINDDSPQKIAAKTAELDAFTRPFYQEGLGMGLAAALDTADADSLGGLRAEVEKLDHDYARLHYVGAGVWFGLEAARSPEAIGRAFNGLGPFGATYAYEGYGFAQALFHLKQDPERLKAGEKLPGLAAQCYYHGAGRAFWILGGEDAAALKARLQLVPAAFRADSTSGYGLGVSFTRGSDPAFVAHYFDRPDFDGLDRDEFAVGVVMGYTIRDIAEHRQGGGPAGSPCWLPEALRSGREALQEVEAQGGDFHANWRNSIRTRVKAPGSFVHHTNGTGCS